MPFKPGQSGNPHGRPVGTKNRATKALKDMILGALEDGGGQDWLRQQMTENPAAFMTLVGKVLPLQVSGEGGGPVIIVTGVQRADDQG
jgi:hypothetical protein